MQRAASSLRWGARCWHAAPQTLPIGLTLRDQAGLEAFIDELNNPDSPNYHQYLTVDEFADRFAPTEADYQAVVDFAVAKRIDRDGNLLQPADRQKR